MNTTISCPHCHKQIDISEALMHDFASQNQKELESFKQQLEQQFKTKEKTELERLKKMAAEQYGQEIESLKEILKDQKEMIAGFRKNEVELRKEKAALEEKSQSVDLEVQRRVDEAKKSIADTVRQQEQENVHLQLKQKDKALEDLKEKIEDMKRKMEQGSVQSQGEIQELEIERILREAFPFDIIEEVHKGVNGSDTNQIVRNNLGKECGVISYESKRTKTFSDKWIDKLKDDMLRVKADFGVIVTETMPSDMPHFGIRNGIWICSFHEFRGLAYALRESLIKIETVKIYQSNSDSKMKLIYEYLTSNEFAQQIEVIVNTFVDLKSDLEQEKRAMSKIWKNREKKIERVIQNTVDFYGSIQGLSGDQLPTIKTLELNPIDNDTEFS